MLVCVAAQNTPGPTIELASVVTLDSGGFLVGAQAEHKLAANPASGTRELKRRFGDPTPVVLDGELIEPHVLVGELLRSIVTQSGVDPLATTLVLTHPAAWRGHKLELLQQIGSSLGFDDIELVSDPVAAVRHYQTTGSLSVGDTVAVYDLGGTFDAATVSIEADGATLIGSPQALERFGGIEIDQLVFQHVASALGGAIDQLDRHDADVRQAVAALRTACTTAKHQLSAGSEASVDVRLPGLHTTVRITRDEFETALRPFITETVQVLERAITSAGKSPDEIAGVVLSGGGSWIPLVAEMVSGHLGRPTLRDLDPMYVVSAGAAAATSPSESAPHPATASNTNADTASAPHRETIMSDQTTPPASPAPTPTGAPGGRSTPPPPPPTAKRGPSKAAKLAGGAAAAAAAVAASVMYGDEIADAAGLGDDDQAAAADASMDAFDEVTAAEPPTPTEPAPEPVTGPLGTPLVDNGATSSQQTESQLAGLRQTQRPDSSSQQREQPAQSTEAGGRDAPRLVREASAQAVETGGEAVAAGRAAAHSEPAPQSAPGVAHSEPAPQATSTEFESARGTLLDRLEQFEAPPGTSAEDAQQLRQDLIDAVERFEPRPGQSTQDALTELRDDYDQRLQDFTQEQKIDALIRETQRDNEAEAAAPDAEPVIESDGEPSTGVDGGIDSTDSTDSTDEADAVEAAEVTGAAAAVDETAVSEKAEEAEAEETDKADSTDEADGGGTLAPLLTAELTDLTMVADVGISDAMIADPSADDDAGIGLKTDDDDEIGLKADDDESPVEVAEVDVDINPAEILIGLDQPLEPTGILIGLDEPAQTGLKDDFDTLIAEPAPEMDPVRGKDLDVDKSAPSPEVTDVRASLPQEWIDNPRMIAADADNDDVIGDSTYATVIEEAAPVTLDIAELSVVGAIATPVDIPDPALEIPDPPDEVEMMFESIFEFATPVEDLSDDVGFAADIAGDVTPPAPDTLSFEP